MSGRKNQLPKFAIVSAGDMSLATVTSSVINIGHMDNIGIQVNILTGTASGAFDVQVSADHLEINGTTTVQGTWISLGTPYTSTITSGSPSSVYFDITQHSSAYMRLLYTKVSGTGTFEAFVVGKMI